MMSHPVWVRGLKLVGLTRNLVLYPSHPVWVRGLKRVIEKEKWTNKKVAPRVGAWIETEIGIPDGVIDYCRTPCGCVD